MDGNGRWAKQRSLPRLAGHRAGGKAADRAIRACLDQGVGYLTLFAFSRENWQRPQEEVEGLMSLLAHYLKQKRDMQRSLNVGLHIIGDKERLGDKVNAEIKAAQACYPDNPDLIVNLALNYSGQWDITQATQQLVAKNEAITESAIQAHLATAHAPLPDLLIRTGGESRISNFMLWQFAYTEFCFIDDLWPDFDQTTLKNCIKAYHSRERRYGMISEQLSPH